MNETDGYDKNAAADGPGASSPASSKLWRARTPAVHKQLRAYSRLHVTFMGRC